MGQGPLPIPCLSFNAFYPDGEHTLSAGTALLQIRQQVFRLDHSRRTRENEGKLVGIAGNYQSGPARLQDITDSLKGAIARVIREQYKSAWSSLIGRQRDYEAGPAATVIQPALAGMADRAEVAEHALFEKGANRGGKRILRTQVVRLPVPSSETNGQAGNLRADIAGAMKEALSDMQAYVYPVICRRR